MDNSMRYFGCAVGFGFGVVWMTVGLGAAIVCVLVAALGYGAVFVAERARDNAITLRPAGQTLTVDEFELDHEHYYEPAEDPQDDATSPLAAEADYGWPVQAPEAAHTKD